MTDPINAVKNRNAILSALTDEVFARIEPLTTVIHMNLGGVLYNADDALDYLYFPLTPTICSIIAVDEEGPSVEISMVTSSGVIDILAFMGAEKAPYQIIVQSAGQLLKVKRQTIVEEFDKDPKTRKAILSFSRRHLLTISQTVLCNRIHSLESRLARWLLMTEDGVEGGELPLTHEFLAKMLGTDRGSVSVAAKILQELKFIAYTKGKITIIDRPSLEGASCECYRFLREQYREIERDAA